MGASLDATFIDARGVWSGVVPEVK